MKTPLAALKQCEAWYIFMVVLGAFNVGFNIMLVPQFVADRFSNGLTLVGTVMAAWCAGALIAPFVSRYIDTVGRPKHWISALLLLNGALAFLVPISSNIVFIIANMLLQGAIYNIGYSLLNLLIIRRFSEPQWHDRTGMLIGAFIVGEVVGFGIGGRVPTPEYGIYLGAVILVISSLFALPMIPDFIYNDTQNQTTEQTRTQNLDDWRSLIASPFGIMALAWGLLGFAAQIIFLPFPVLMKETFAIEPGISSMTVSLSGLIALAFYPIVGSLTSRFGADNILIISSTVKAMVFAVLAACALGILPPYAWLVLGMIFINRNTWPFMMASSQIQAAQLSQGHSKNLALSLFMATFGVFNALSGIANSMVTALWGMEYVPLVATIAALSGIFMLIGNKYRNLSPQEYLSQARIHHP